MTSGKFLVTGGAGFIGSHMAAKLLAHGHRVVVLDDLSNSHANVLKRIEEVAGRPAVFVEGDIRDRVLLERVFAEHKFDAVLHFAGLKSIAASLAQPGLHYDVNVGGALNLFQVMEKTGMRRLLFSSSATVYADAGLWASAYAEDSALGPDNVYGRTKWMVETMLGDMAAADPEWRISVLRYFNPAGAHPSGLLGEAPSGVPGNLVPYILQVASGKRDVLNIYGGDYPTPDGTAMRDYIHIEDLVEGHIAALQALDEQGGLRTFNLGTGIATSVRQMVAMFETVTGKPIPVRVMERRPGDVIQTLADPSSAERELGWRSRLGLKDICSDAWRWQEHNLDGSSV